MEMALKFTLTVLENCGRRQLTASACQQNPSILRASCKNLIHDQETFIYLDSYTFFKRGEFTISLENVPYFGLGILFSIIFFVVMKGIYKLRSKGPREDNFFIKKFQRASRYERINLFFKRFNAMFITVTILLVSIVAIDYIAKNIKLEFNLVGYILLLIIILVLIYLSYALITAFLNKEKRFS